MEHVNELFAALIGAGAWGIVHYLVMRKSTNADGLNDYAARLIRDENQTLREKINLVEGYNAKHIQRIAELERKLFELEHQIEIMKFAPFEIPLPMWIKALSGVAIFVTEEYVEEFLKPRGYKKSDYVGSTDFAVWPQEIAEEYRKNDQEVISSGKIFHGRERVVDNLGNVQKWLIMKFPGPIPGSVAGIAFPDNGYYEQYISKKQTI